MGQLGRNLCCHTPVLEVKQRGAMPFDLARSVLRSRHPSVVAQCLPPKNPGRVLHHHNRPHPPRTIPFSHTRLEDSWLLKLLVGIEGCREAHQNAATTIAGVASALPPRRYCILIRPLAADHVARGRLVFRAEGATWSMGSGHCAGSPKVIGVPRDRSASRCL